MLNVDELDERFGIEGELGFSEQEDGLIFISVYNKFAEAEISLYGAHITRFVPHGTFDVLWLGQESSFEYGKPIRGGIPICFPWFGPHPENQELPLHGFVRIMNWDVVETGSLPGGESKIVLKFSSSDETMTKWLYEFEAFLTVVVGKQLDVSFSVANMGKEKFRYTSALHTYLNVSEISNVAIEGLQGTPYYQPSDDRLRLQEENFLVIDQETNRRYIETSNDCAVHDAAFSRKIVVAKSGSNSTVVWNPWSEVSKGIPDLADDDYQTFVCVETANIYNDQVCVYPGESHTTSLVLSVEQQTKSLNGNTNDSGINIMGM